MVRKMFIDTKNEIITRTKETIGMLAVIKELAEEGLPDAFYHLGLCYESGESVEKSLSWAYEMFSKAAEVGHCLACLKTGYYLEKGLGILKDESSAVTYYQKASDLHVIEAMWRLGDMYRDGRGVDQDYIRAKMLYESACNHADNHVDKKICVEAEWRLGAMYEDGLACERNVGEAIRHYKRASCHKDVKDTDIASMEFRFAKLTETDKWNPYVYEEAALCGSIEAMRLYVLRSKNSDVLHDDLFSQKYFDKFLDALVEARDDVGILVACEMSMRSWERRRPNYHKFDKRSCFKFLAGLICKRNIDACFLMAIGYIYGDWGKRDLYKNLRCYNLAFICANKLGVRNVLKYRKRFFELLKLYEADDGDAAYEIFKLFGDDGCLCAPQVGFSYWRYCYDDISEYWFREACRLGSAASIAIKVADEKRRKDEEFESTKAYIEKILQNVNVSYWDREKIKEKFEYIKECAENGNKEAMLLCARTLVEGWSYGYNKWERIPSDQQKARDLFVKMQSWEPLAEPDKILYEKCCEYLKYRDEVLLALKNDQLSRFLIELYDVQRMALQCISLLSKLALIFSSYKEDMYSRLKKILQDIHPEIQECFGAGIHEEIILPWSYCRKYLSGRRKLHDEIHSIFDQEYIDISIVNPIINKLSGVSYEAVQFVCRWLKSNGLELYEPLEIDATRRRAIINKRCGKKLNKYLELVVRQYYKNKLISTNTDKEYIDDRRKDEDIKKTAVGESFYFVERAAQMGEPRCLYWTAYMDLFNDAEPIDYEGSVNRFEMAAKKGVAKAYTALGIINESFRYKRRNVFRAAAFYLKAYQMGDSYAAYHIGKLCERFALCGADKLLFAENDQEMKVCGGELEDFSEFLITKSEENSQSYMDAARAWYEIGAKKYDGRAMYEIIKYSQSSSNIVNLYENALLYGSGDAAYALGCLYENGKLVTKDLKRAREYYEQAKIMKLINENVEWPLPQSLGDFKWHNCKGLHFWELSHFAELGDVDAQYLWGCVHINGGEDIKDSYFWIIDANLNDARIWLRRATAQGNLRAMTMLGVLDEKERGCWKFPAIKNSWFISAAKRGGGYAAWKLYKCRKKEIDNYRDKIKELNDSKEPIDWWTIGVLLEEKRKFNAASDWYKKAADAGFTPGAVSNFKLKILRRISITEDISLLMEAAQTGDVGALYYLGWCYECGIGVNKSLENAIKIYNLVSMFGVVSADVGFGRVWIKMFKRSEGVDFKWDLERFRNLRIDSVDYSFAKEIVNAFELKCDISPVKHLEKALQKDNREAIKLLGLYYSLPRCEAKIASPYDEYYKADLGIAIDYLSKAEGREVGEILENTKKRLLACEGDCVKEFRADIASSESSEEVIPI